MDVVDIHVCIGVQGNACNGFEYSQILFAMFSLVLFIFKKKSQTSLLIRIFLLMLDANNKDR